jgi:hypothetical protein
LVILPDDEPVATRIAPSFRCASIDALTPGLLSLPGGRLAQAPNILLAGYEFEGGKAAIS